MEREQLILTPDAALSEPPLKPVKITPRIMRIADAAVEISQNPPTDKDKAYATRYLVQATLPHRTPKGNPPYWARINGNYSLTIQPGVIRNRKTGEVESVGYPSGTIPRLLLYWMTTDTIRTKGRKLFLGDSLTEFMLKLGLNPRNGSPRSQRSDRRRLLTQAQRLFRARFSFEYTGPNSSRYLSMEVAPEEETFWDLHNPDQMSIWDSWVELGEKFYQALIDGSFPVDMRALRALKDSALDLDVYAWVNYKTHQATTKNRAFVVPYRLLGEQLGADYSDPKDLTKKLKRSLKKVQALSEGVNLDEEPGAIIIRPGRTAIPSR